MATSALSTKTISLTPYGIKNATTHYQLEPEDLQAISLDLGQGRETSTGALAIDTGTFTGRSPKDRFIVIDELTRDDVWWRYKHPL